MAASVGVLGGSFDPIHRGHIRLAREARSKLGLDRVLLVPAAQQPLKPGRPEASDAERRHMIERALRSPEGGAGEPWLKLSTIELERGGPSYTVDTLEALKEQLGWETDLVFLAGADVLQDLWRWRRVDRLLELARFCVATRPGHAVEVPAGLRGRVTTFEIDAVYASSTAVRDAFASGEPERARAMLVPEVWSFIEERGLYGTDLAMTGRGAPPGL
jgi:nicotinate-nucleotide adenylyltransferase